MVRGEKKVGAIAGDAGAVDGCRWEMPADETTKVLGAAKAATTKTIRTILHPHSDERASKLLEWARDDHTRTTKLATYDV